MVAQPHNVVCSRCQAAAAAAGRSAESRAARPGPCIAGAMLACTAAIQRQGPTSQAIAPGARRLGKQVSCTSAQPHTRSVAEDADGWECGDVVLTAQLHLRGTVHLRRVTKEQAAEEREQGVIVQHVSACACAKRAGQMCMQTFLPLASRHATPCHRHGNMNTSDWSACFPSPRSPWPGGCGRLPRDTCCGSPRSQPPRWGPAAGTCTHQTAGAAVSKRLRQRAQKLAAVKQPSASPQAAGPSPQTP